MRVFITGIGIVSPLGVGARITMDRLVRGERALGPVTLFDAANERTNIAAEVRDLTIADVAPRGEAAIWSRTDAMALVAAREALHEARLDARRTPIDLVTGGTTGGMFETEDLLAAMLRDPSKREPALGMLSHPLSATADRLQSVLGPFVRARSICSACSSGANAILAGAVSIRAGRARAVLAGGADGLCRLTYAGFNALGAIDRSPCRPFDQRRAGLNLGEGAAYVVLEGEEDALARGAVPIAELSGWAVGSEAHHITNPEREGTTAERLIREALLRAGLSPADLGYVNAHGTATPLNDSMEATALRSAMGEESRRVPVSSSKGQIGHTLGAAGAIEGAITALAIARGEIPPTVGLEQPDPACDLRHVMGVGEKRAVQAALSNSFGFGGTDTVLALTRPGRFAPPQVALRGKERNRVLVTAAATVGSLGVSGSQQTVAYLEPGDPPSATIDFDEQRYLDVAKSRRLDRASRLLTTAMQSCLQDARAIEHGPDARRIGIVGGAAFGSVDSSAAFIQRVYEKGGRFASPAAFPNLVPSSPAGHASIYLGLRGLVLSMADLAATAEGTAALAVELIEEGEADAMLAGTVEEASSIIERVLGPVCSESATLQGVRSEGAVALLFEEERSARRRKAPVLARVVATACGRGVMAAPIQLASGGIPRPSARSLVVVSRVDATTLDALAVCGWEGVQLIDVSPRSGHHEGAGGFALAAAASAIAEGRADETLVFGHARDRWVLFVLARE